MYGKKEEPWDAIPEMRQRTFEHLAQLAQVAVKELLGPSPQEVQERDDREHYRRAYRYWLEEKERAEQEDLPPPPPPEEPESRSRNVDLDAWLKRRLQEKLLAKLDTALLELIGVENHFGSLRMKSSGSPLGQRLTDKAKEMAVALADRWVEENKDFVVFTDKNPERDRLIAEIRVAESAMNKTCDEISVLRPEDSKRRESLDLQLKEHHAMIDDAKARLASMDARYNKDGVRIEDVFRHFRHELERATKSALEERIKKIAVERAALVKQEVLEAAVDKAMYDTYPILRRAEAAKRLDAKVEDVT